MISLTTWVGPRQFGMERASLGVPMPLLGWTKAVWVGPCLFWLELTWLSYFSTLFNQSHVIIIEQNITRWITAWLLFTLLSTFQFNFQAGNFRCIGGILLC